MKKLTLNRVQELRYELLSKVPRFIEYQKRKRKFGADEIQSRSVKKLGHFSKTRRMEVVDGHLDGVHYDLSAMLSGNDVKQDMDDPSFLENDNIIIIVKDEHTPESGSSDKDNFEEQVVRKLEALFSKNGKPKETQKEYNQVLDLIERPDINFEYGNRNGKFLCHICGITILDTVSFHKHLRRHEAMEANLRSHKCLICGKAFNLSSSLRIHKLKVHYKEKHESLMYVCSLCGKRSFSREHVLTCETSHSELDPLTPFQCHCGKAFASQYKLMVHKINDHRNKKNKVVSSVNRYKPCLQNFFSASELKKHQQAELGKKINCPVCDRELASIITLAFHLKGRHGITNPSKEKMIKCRFCDKSFVMFASFVRHTRDRHGHEVGAEEILEMNREIQESYGGLVEEMKKTPSRGKVKMTCPFCLRTLANPASLNSHIETIHHIQTLSRTKSFCCGVCGRGFIMLTSYIYHKMKAHEEDVTPEELEAMASKSMAESPVARPKATCAQCGKIFKSVPCLRSHEYRVHRTKQIKCVDCKEAFDNRQVYFEHKYEAHTPLKDKVCVLCNKEFRSYSAHWGHKMYVHTTPSHRCDFCTSVFKRKGDLARHLRDKHGALPAPAGPDAPEPAVDPDPDAPEPVLDAYLAVENDIDSLTFEVFESDSVE